MATDNNAILLPAGVFLDGGKYRIEKPLASGGFGNTYLATDVRMDVRCVIKEFFMNGINVRTNGEVTVSVPGNQTTFENQRQKFTKEAQRLFRLNNTHIVRVHALFDENGTSYYVMDYVDGLSLSERLKQQGCPMQETEVRNILFQLADALKSVHNQQEPLLHLDLKPGNILMDSTGRVVLIDFGASKQTGAGEGMTSTAMCYTPGYAPVEQMEQDFASIGPWTDIYALGATLYNLLTLNRPPSISSLHRSDAFSFPPGVSMDMQSLIRWMMMPRQEDRPQRVEDIDLRLASPHSYNTTSAPEEPTQVVSPSSAQSPAVPPFVQKPRNTISVLLWSLLGILVLASIFVGVKFAGSSEKESDDDELAETTELSDNDGEEEMSVISGDVSSELRDSISYLMQAWDQGHCTGGEDMLKSLYADEVLFFGEKLSREKVVEMITANMRKAGGHKQKSSNIRIKRMADGRVLCEFDKHGESGNGKTGDYQAYLYFKFYDYTYMINEESDLTSDRNLKKQKEKSSQANSSDTSLHLNLQGSLGGNNSFRFRVDGSSGSYTYWNETYDLTRRLRLISYNPETGELSFTALDSTGKEIGWFYGILTRNGSHQTYRGQFVNYKQVKCDFSFSGDR